LLHNGVQVGGPLGDGGTVAGMPGRLFTIEFIEEDDGRRPVEDWMESALTDMELAALGIRARRTWSTTPADWGPSFHLSSSGPEPIERAVS
jgi:hypothetical protein